VVNDPKGYSETYYLTPSDKYIQRHIDEWQKNVQPDYHSSKTMFYNWKLEQEKLNREICYITALDM
jgi:hypothetical protein